MSPAPSAPRRPPAVVLVRPREEGNVGAVARAMANMGLDHLLLVEPAVAIGAVARARAVHAGHLLDAAERHPDLDSALAGFGRIVATTAARDRTWPQRLATPRELPVLLSADPLDTSTAILFGPEVSGLTNDELARASLLVSIPAADRQPTLNLAQAVLVVAYELHLAGDLRHRTGAAGDDVRATGDELAAFSGQLGSLLARVGFARDTTVVRVERDLRRLVARAVPTRREIRILRGILRRAGHTFARLDRHDPRGSKTPR